MKKDKAVMYSIRQDTLSEQSKVLKSLCRALWFILTLLELTFQWWERDNKNSNQPVTYQMEISAKEEQSKLRQGCDGCDFRPGGQGGLMGKDVPVETPRG